jgi:hypothetical protein
MRTIRHPAVILYVLSPGIAELLSGSTPPAEFFNPFGFLLLTAFYGSGALLARELTLRWNKGWPTVVLLGMAYGIVEEGLAVKSFFDPNWMDLGPLGVYGRWAGVNWVWSAGLTLYHAVFSIAIPIMLTNLLFPAWKARPWLSRRAFRVWSAVLALVVLLCNLLLTSYRPSFLHLGLSSAAVIGLCALARRAPATAQLRSAPRLPRPLGMFGRGFAATVGLFILLWVLPNTAIPAFATLMLLVGWASFVVRQAARLADHPDWSPSQTLATASGALLFFILLAPLTQLDPNPPDDRSGMALVALGAALFLVWVGRHLRTTAPGAALGPAPQALTIPQEEAA